MFRRIGLTCRLSSATAVAAFTLRRSVVSANPSVDAVAGVQCKRSFATAAPPSPPTDNRKWYLVEYDYVPDILVKRAAYRAAHLAAAQSAKARGEFILGGALVPASDGARIVFRVKDKKVVEEFVRTDPYVMSASNAVVRCELCSRNAQKASATVYAPAFNVDVMGRQLCVDCMVPISAATESTSLLVDSKQTEVLPTCAYSVDELIANGLKHAGTCTRCKQPVFRHSNLTDAAAVNGSRSPEPHAFADCRCTFCGDVAKCVRYESSNNTYQFTCKCANAQTEKPYRAHPPRFPSVAEDIDAATGKFKFGCTISEARLLVVGTPNEAAGLQDIKSEIGGHASSATATAATSEVARPKREPQLNDELPVAVPDTKTSLPEPAPKNWSGNVLVRFNDAQDLHSVRASGSMSADDVCRLAFDMYRTHHSDLVQSCARTLRLADANSGVFLSVFYDDTRIEPGGTRMIYELGVQNNSTLVCNVTPLS